MYWYFPFNRLLIFNFVSVYKIYEFTISIDTRWFAFVVIAIMWLISFITNFGPFPGPEEAKFKWSGSITCVYCR